MGVGAVSGTYPFDCSVPNLPAKDRAGIRNTECGSLEGRYSVVRTLKTVLSVLQQCLNLLEGLPVYNRIMSFAGIEHIFLTAVLRLLERNGGVSICLLISAVTHVTLIGENIGYLCGSPLLFAELGLDAFFGQIPCYFTGRPPLKYCWKM